MLCRMLCRMLCWIAVLDCCAAACADCWARHSFLFYSVPLPQLLEDIGALNEQEHLTSLGRHLAALPLPPALGKMLLYGVLFSCLDPILTVACCMAYRWVLVGAGGWVGVGGWPGGWVGGWVGAACGPLRAPPVSFPATYTNAMHCLPGCPPGCLCACRDPWVLPAAADARRQATLTRARLSSDAGGASDHLAAIKAYNQWKGASAVSGWPRTSSCWLPAAVAAWAAWAAWAAGARSRHCFGSSALCSALTTTRQPAAG